jgi:alpha-galactosidase
MAALKDFAMNGKSHRLGAVVFVSGLVLLGLSAGAETIRLDQLDVGNTEQDWGQPHRNLSVEGHPLKIGETGFEHGLGTHATSTLYVTLNGATQFTAKVGVDAEVASPEASIEFFVLNGGKTLWQSGVMKAGEPAKSFTLDLSAVKTLTLKVGDAGDGINFDHADWADARFQYDGAPPATAAAPREEAVILTPPDPPQPRINGPAVIGARPGHPFFYHVPVTGEAPVKVTADKLPSGLNLDAARGDITGVVAQAGEFQVKLSAQRRRWDGTVGIASPARSMTEKSAAPPTPWCAAA